jgi:hypothetical protein
MIHRRGGITRGLHMFISGLSPHLPIAFLSLTMATGVPSAVKTFNGMDRVGFVSGWTAPGVGRGPTQSRYFYLAAARGTPFTTVRREVQGLRAETQERVGSVFADESLSAFAR